MMQQPVLTDYALRLIGEDPEKIKHKRAKKLQAIKEDAFSSLFDKKKAERKLVSDLHTSLLRDTPIYEL
jgi:CRISPR/Cas system CSM-associated protein Csm4 (group 5 of RAMP superfamily)